MKQRSIGRYQVKQEIDHGGMSIVYLAHDPRFRRDVAIKVLSSNLQEQALVRARFEREAHIIASLDHPAIVPVYDFGEEGGQPYLVMRLMPGGSLSDLLTFGRLNLADTAHIAERIGSALDAAHQRGVVHRDLKPANILFDAHGEAFLTDFGIVKIFEDGSAQADMTGSVVLGTPAYMSPEQALGKPIDKRSDVYALGAVMYEMLTGLPPYKGPTSVSIAMKHVMEPVPHVFEFRSDIPQALDAVVARAMAKEPAERYESAGELAHAFAAALRDVPQTVQTGGSTAAAARKPITEAQARLRVSAPPSEPATKRVAPGIRQPAEDTQIQGGRRWIFWLAVAAGVLAFIGIALSVIATLITPDRSSIATPAAAATATQSMPLPQVATAAPQQIAATEVIAAVTATSNDAQTTQEPASNRQPIMRVDAGGGNARSGPGTVYPILKRMPEATDLLAIAFVRGTDGKLWFEFLFADGQRGFMREDVVTLSSAAAFDQLPQSANIPAPPRPTSTVTATSTPLPQPTATFLPTQTFTPLPAPTTLAVTPTPIPFIVQTPTAGATTTVAPSPTTTTAPPTTTPDSLATSVPSATPIPAP